MNGETIAAQSPAIIDTGTTLLMMSSDAYAKYAAVLSAATGAKLDPSTGLLAVSPNQVARAPPLMVVIDGNAFPLSADSQFFPLTSNAALTGKSSINLRYNVVASTGTPTGSGLDVIMGYACEA